MLSIDTQRLDPEFVYQSLRTQHLEPVIKVLPAEAVRQKFPKAEEPVVPIPLPFNPAGAIVPTLAALCGVHPSGAPLALDVLRERAREIGMLSEKVPTQWKLFVKERLAQQAEAGV